MWLDFVYGAIFGDKSLAITVYILLGMNLF
jgi:hypothetical protein